MPKIHADTKKALPASEVNYIRIKPESLCAALYTYMRDTEASNQIMNKNTMTIGEYLFENVFWCAISMLWFKNLFFRCLPNYSLSTSRLFLWGELGLFVVFGIMTTVKQNRNYLSLIVNILMPYEIYYIVAYKYSLNAFSYIMLATAGLLSVLYLRLLLSGRIREGENRKKAILCRIRNGINGVRMVVVFFLVFLIVPTLISVIWHDSLIARKTPAIVPGGEVECTIANNIDTVANMQNNIWCTLSDSERTDTLQVIANIEAHYLGLSHELNVVVQTLNESTVAQYNDRTHTIAVNIAFLEVADAEEMLDSICHEAYHAYQHRVVDAYINADESYKDLLIFYPASVYQREFAMYTAGNENPIEYYFQRCELTAREYATVSTDEYYARIDAHLDIGTLS